MKLRNKKTGEIADLDDWTLTGANDRITVESDHDMTKIFDYNSLAELNEEWEDYEPKEPLIKDEKIRKAVRAFWEAISDAVIDKRILYKKNQDLAVGVYSIYCGAIYPETLEVGKMYTIAELCGEEEAPEPLEPTLIDLDERIKEKEEE